jgi:hypothetical protein
VARKDPKRKSNREGRRGTDLLGSLDNAKAASVLKTLLARHWELRPEAEAIARDLLTEISPFSVADDVENTLLQYDYDDLNSRAGGHSWGYVEPTEAAWELLEEAVEPFVSEMKRYLEMGLEEQALQFCQGVLLGLYRVRDGQDNDILGWAEDFPAEAAGNMLDVWMSAAGIGGEGETARPKPRALPPGFVREHLPDWGWLLKPAAGN